MAGTLTVDTIQSDSSYASTLNVASKINFAGGIQVGGLDATFGGRRNKLINGDFKIDQRADYAEVNPANMGYNIDMWLNINSATGKAKQQIVRGGGPVGFNTYHAYTSLSAYTPSAAQEFGLIQRIEGYNLVDLAYGTPSAKTTTVSFWVYASIPGTYSVGLFGLFGVASDQRCNASTYTVNQANTWEYKTVTFAGDQNYSFTNKANAFSMEVRFGFGGGSSCTTSTVNQWQSGNFSNVSGTVQTISTSGAYVYLTGVQFEIGSSATAFEYRTFAEELALCQRYLPVMSYSGGSNPYFGAGMAYSTTAAYYTINFPVTPRVPPTGLTVSSASHFSGFLASSATSPATGFVFGGADSHSAFVQLSGMSGLVAGNASLIYLNNSAAKLIFTGSEL